jgi:ribose transport system ATP-binding protein
LNDSDGQVLAVRTIDGMSDAMASTVFELKHVSKSFPGVKALQEVSFDLHEGEIHALLGENGAGKSTLIKVATGVYQPDEGTIGLFGKEIHFSNPDDAFASGIAVVHQELNSFQDLTVAENILFRQYPKNRFGMIDWKRMNKLAKAAMEKIEVEIDPEKRIKDCPVAEKQQVEIARMLFWNAKILILDEPTSSLNELETTHLLSYLKKIRNMGVSIVYISHKLDEIFTVADRVTILRDGMKIDTVSIVDTNSDILVEKMVGRTVDDMFASHEHRIGEEVLRVEGMTTSLLKGIEFNVHKGEIFGIYGLMGSGHLEIGKALFGYGESSNGRITIGGKIVKIDTAYDAVRNGLAYVPSERKTEGLVLPHSVRSNIMIAHYEVNGEKITSSKLEVDTAARWIDSLQIKTSGQDVAVETLSGGNQQKVVLAKWLEVRPTVLILNEPTRGIDIGAKVGIYKLLGQLCKQGVAIIMITSEMPELIAMSDRVLVVNEGEPKGLFERNELSEITIMQSIMGATHV